MTDSEAVFSRGDYSAPLVSALLQPSVDLSVSFEPVYSEGRYLGQHDCHKRQLLFAAD